MNRFFSFIALTGALLVASSPALATATFKIFETGTTNAAISASPGATVTLDLVVETTGTLNAYGVSIETDVAGTPSNPVNTPIPGSFPGAPPSCNGTTCGSWNALSLSAFAAGSYVLGTLDVQVSATGGTVTPGLFDPSMDSVSPLDEPVVFEAAMITTPEPATALLGMVPLVTLGLLRRSRRD